MPMEIDRKQLKQRAREAMSLSNPSFWLVTLVYLLMTTGVSYVVDLAPGSMSRFLFIAFTLYSWVVGFSYRLWAIWTCRRLEPDLGSLMEGFSVAGRVIVMELSILLRTIGWSFLLAIPVGLIVTAAGTLTSDLSVLLVVYFALLLVVAIAVEIITLRYSLAPFVLADYPDLGPAVAVAHSVRLTKGWIWELLKLHLSFAGWYILSGALTCIGMSVGLSLSGALGGLFALPLDQLMTQLQTLVTTPFTSLLATLVSLPVTLYLTPYVEVSVAEFYNARINLGDNMADPMGGMQMPPV